MKIKTISEMGKLSLRKEARTTLMWFYESCTRYSFLATINTMNEKLSYLESIMDDDNSLLGFMNYSIMPPNKTSDAFIVVLNIGISNKLAKERLKDVLCYTLSSLQEFHVPIVYIGKNDFEINIVTETGLVDAVIPLQKLEE